VLQKDDEREIVPRELVGVNLGEAGAEMTKGFGGFSVIGEDVKSMFGSAGC
jgi:hypothetical protein